MSSTTSANIEKLVIHRTYKAPASRVYAAWTQADLLKQWFRPEDAFLSEAHLDVRVGGTYGITFQTPNGSLKVGGTFREVREGERLVFTWRWEEDTPEEEYDTLVTLDFREHNGETDFTLTHENFAKEESRENHSRGWNSALDKLPAFL